MKKFISFILITAFFILPLNNIVLADEAFAEGFYVLSANEKQNAETVNDTIDNTESTKFTFSDGTKRLAYAYNFKAGRIYRINVNMRVLSGSTALTMSLIRPEALPAREYISNTVTVGTEYKTYALYYKCGDDSIAYDTYVPGYVAFYSSNAATELMVRSVTVSEISTAIHPYQNIPYKVSSDVFENKDIITRLLFAGIMRNRSTGFCPEDAITRSEFVQGILSAGGYAAVAYNNVFSDVSRSTLYSGFIQKAYDMGLISGTNFYPEQNADQSFIEALCEGVYNNYSQKSLTYEELGNPDIASDGIVTRRKAAKILYNMREKLYNEKLEDAFIAWANKAQEIYLANSMIEEAVELSREIENWKVNTKVEKIKDNDFIVNVNDFYENPASKKIISEIIKYAINSSGYKYISVGDAARNEFKSYTDPTSKANWMQALIWAMINEDSPYIGNAYALTFALSYLEMFTYIINDGNSQYYFSNKDSNYNMFFFQEYMYAYLLLKSYYPCFILPTMQEKTERIVREAISYQERENSNLGKGYYANVDVMLANMYAYAGRILNDEEYIEKADEILENVASTIYEDGGIPYLGSENEISSYHNNIMKDVGMNYLVTKSRSAEKLLRKAQKYYTVTLDNNDYAENATAVVFKQNWGVTTIMPGVSVSAYFEDGGKNKAIEERFFKENPYMIGNTFKEALITGAYYSSEKTSDISVYDDGIVEDKNIGGARGKFKDFSYSLDFRNRRLRENYPISFPGNGIHNKGTYPGKSTYVGVYSTAKNSYNALNGAISKVYSSVKYANTGRKYSDITNVTNYSDEWFEMGENYALGGATYSLGTYGASSMTYNSLDGFLGHEMWYAEGERLIGLMTVDALCDTQVFGQSARIQMLNSGFNEYDLKENTELQRISDDTYRYADIGIKIHDTNYNGISVDNSAYVMNATVHASGKSATELIIGENTNRSYDVKCGERKYIIIEFYNAKTTAPLDNVSYNEDNGVYSLNISNKRIVYNLSDRSIISNGREYSHGQGGCLEDYSFGEKQFKNNELFLRDFEPEKYSLGDKGYYTGNNSDRSVENVLYFDSGSDATKTPRSHFEICEENGNKYLKFKAQGVNNTDSGNVKAFYLQFSNMNGFIPFGKMLFENTDTSVENFNIEFDLKCKEESFDTEIRIELYQNTQNNARGNASAFVIPCGEERFGTDWVHHKLVLNKRDKKIYLYKNNVYCGEYAISASTDIFRNGINLIRIYYRGKASGGSFVKDGVGREIGFDNFKITIPSVSYTEVSIENGDNITVSAKVLNNTFELKNAKLYAALYDGDRLLDVIDTDVTELFPASTKTIDLSGCFENKERGNKLKVYLWDELYTIVPLEDVIVK